MKFKRAKYKKVPVIGAGADVANAIAYAIEKEYAQMWLYFGFATVAVIPSGIAKVSEKLGIKITKKEGAEKLLKGAKKISAEEYEKAVVEVTSYEKVKVVQKEAKAVEKEVVKQEAKAIEKEVVRGLKLRLGKIKIYKKNR